MERFLGRQAQIVGKNEVLHDVQAPRAALHGRQALLGPAQGLGKGDLGQATVVIERGWRLAQLVVAPVVAARLSVVAALDDTSRAGGGFGSTGGTTV